MQKSNAITHQPIIIGLLLSIGIHAVLLRSSNLHQVQPVPQLETGRHAVYLTLIPSPASELHAKESAAPVTQHVEVPQTSPLLGPTPVAKVREEPAASATIAQDAMMETDEGVTAEAVSIGTFHPAYPRISRRRGEEGTVTLQIQVLSDGTVGRVDILQSSGFQRLDHAAVNGASMTTYQPALQSGRAIESTTELTYTFRLTDD